MRIADSTTISDETETEWSSGDDLLGSEPIFLADARPEGDARVLSFGPFLILSSATNQTIVAISPGHSAEVFCFSVPSPPRLGQWSQWQKPTFTETALTPGSIVDGAATEVRRTDALTTRFEFRFQFTEAATTD